MIDIKIEALIMANARRLIKANKSTKNCSLYSELFGVGGTSSLSKCKELGLDPYSNETCYNKMCIYINSCQELK